MGSCSEPEEREKVPNSVRPTGSPVAGSSGLPRYFTPTNPMPGKKGAEPKIAGGKVQPIEAPSLNVFS